MIWREEGASGGAAQAVRVRALSWVILFGLRTGAERNWGCGVEICSFSWGMGGTRNLMVWADWGAIKIVLTTKKNDENTHGRIIFQELYVGWAGRVELWLGFGEDM